MAISAEDLRPAQALGSGPFQAVVQWYKFRHIVVQRSAFSASMIAVIAPKSCEIERVFARANGTQTASMGSVIFGPESQNLARVGVKVVESS